MEKGWNGLPYYSISDRYKSLFGAKVYKIPVAVVDDCPNRLGLKGMQTCSFCDVWGSAARSEAFDLSLTDQIHKYRAHIKDKYKASQFLVYFQAYTNSFAKIADLELNFKQSLDCGNDIVGFVVGTRPDCLSLALFKLWQTYHEQKHVSVELGIQSFFEDDLIFFRRGHTAEESLRAIKKIKDLTTVDLGIHLIFGSPYETDKRIKESALMCNDLPITNVKLHNLHVLKNTALETLYNNGSFTPISLEVYAQRVQIFLEHLRPDIAIHRLSAFSSRYDELVAPQWTSNKMGTHQAIIDHLRRETSFQSRFYSPKSESENILQRQLAHQSSPSTRPTSSLNSL
ncbi:MAG: TIGR01212 family radical SAM protein [Bdellovibrionaceae bacterium]|nr:TIGR01212 family radical SAM protein [Pseudobdellovibrionaceae bacterium]